MRTTTRNHELLRGQKLMGWVLILMGLLILILKGLVQSLADRYPLPVLATLASVDPTMLGVVAWLLLGAGYMFVVSGRLEDRFRELEGQLEERINRVTRGHSALEKRVGGQSGT